MTREQLIKQAANEYMDNYVPDICGMCLEDIWDAFIAGAEWANKHPDLSSLWHDATEEPKGDEWEVLCDAGDCYLTTSQITLVWKDGRSWDKYVRGNDVERWLYLSDLFPKGGVK